MFKHYPEESKEDKRQHSPYSSLDDLGNKTGMNGNTQGSTPTKSPRLNSSDYGRGSLFSLSDQKKSSSPYTQDKSSEDDSEHLAELPDEIFSTQKPYSAASSPMEEGRPLSRGPAFATADNRPLEEPETVIGENLRFKGDLSFEKYLRIDGFFEGKMHSEGKLHIGQKGKVIADLHLSEVIIEGRLEGNIHAVGRVELRGDAIVIGNITASTLSIDEGVTLQGQVIVPSNPS